MGSDDSAMMAAQRKQQEELDRMTEEEKRKNKMAQSKNIRNMKTAMGSSTGFNQGSDTLG